jgi:hypothetical protein
LEPNLRQAGQSSNWQLLYNAHSIDPESEVIMSQPDHLSGMEPQIGQQQEAAAPSPEARQRADQLFNEALRYIERMRWGAASVALRRALAAVPGYPQASGLLALVDEIRIYYDHGIPDSRQLEALRAYIAALRANAPPPEPAPRAPAATPGALSAGIALPWADDQPAASDDVFRWRGPIDEEIGFEAPPAPSRWALPALSAANPLDHLRVFVWFFIGQRMLVAYNRAGQWWMVKPVLAWLASTVLWLPLLMPTLGLTIGTLPAAESGLRLSWLPVLLVLMWALGGWLAFNRSAVSLLLASAFAILLFVLLMGTVGYPTAISMGVTFLGMAGVAAGIMGIEAKKASTHLALGAAYVVTVAAVFRTFIWIAPIVNDYVRGFILGSVGGPILIGLAVGGTGLFALGAAYVIPYIGNYLVSFIVEAIAESGSAEETGIEMLGMGVLALSVLSMLFLAWVSFLGGYQYLWLLAR